MKFNLRLLGAFFLVLGILAAGCKEEVLLVDNMPDKLFRPVAFTASVNGNNVGFSWVPIKGASYSLELRRDGSTEGPKVFKLDSTTTFQVEDLYSETLYKAKIKAVSKNNVIGDSGYQEVAFTTGIENIFFQVSEANKTSEMIILEWDKSKAVSKIVVSATGVDSREILLSPAEVSEGRSRISGLLSGKAYAFSIYLNDMKRGTISVTTR